MPPKVATRSSLEQVAIIDAMLSRPQGALVGELCERMDCHPKTVMRHMSWMRRKFDMRIERVGHETGSRSRFVYPLGQSRIFTKEACRTLSAGKRFVS